MHNLILPSSELDEIRRHVTRSKKFDYDIKVPRIKEKISGKTRKVRSRGCARHEGAGRLVSARRVTDSTFDWPRASAAVGRPATIAQSSRDMHARDIDQWHRAHMKPM
ncbi:hypothetical protein KIN20_020807 [Parelaphostrongylus tenuis]|uniref:Uncharacterized protein n=1 Tax=Parelaphostrongylus tenuis TaxID=148309 RepID=A0AAD5MTB3_PARTN|nr:hypothetical protein KIN20_020807 [Parelaphostrongylus tenuis]